MTNATGVVTNLQGFVSKQIYDINLHATTTNFFQFFDIDLTNGENAVCVRAVDLAGNTTVTNLIFTLTGDTVPPAIALSFPQNDMRIAGDSLTVNGLVDDPTAKVVLLLADTVGQSNSYSAEVERHGRFWVENVPLAVGTNFLTITATDTWNNSSTSNFTVIKTNFALNFDAIDPAQLSARSVALRGTVSDAACTVWVNGVRAQNLGDGTWQCTNAPVTPTGVARFQLTAYPAGHDPGSVASDPDFGNPSDPAALNVATNLAKPWDYYVDWDVQVVTASSCEDWTERNNDRQYIGSGNRSRDYCYSHFWQRNLESHGSQSEDSASHSEGPGGSGGISTAWSAEIVWPPWETPVVNGFEMFSGDYDQSIHDNPETVSPPLVGWEHCEVGDKTNRNYADLPTSQGTISGCMDDAYGRIAQTTIKLYTGGKALSHRQNLFSVIASAGEVLNPRATPPFISTLLGPIPYDKITVGDFGKVDTNWLVLKTLPEDTVVDITVRAPGYRFYRFGTTAQKREPVISRDDIPVTDQTNAVWVGQHVRLKCTMDPEIPLLTPSYTWTVPGESVAYFKITFNSGTNVPLTRLHEPSLSYYWVDRLDGAAVQCEVTAGASSAKAQTTFNVFKPNATWQGRTNNEIFVSNAWLRDGTPPVETAGMIFACTNLDLQGYSGTYELLTAQIASINLNLTGLDLDGLGLSTNLSYSGIDTRELWRYDSFGQQTSWTTQDSPAVMVKPNPEEPWVRFSRIQSVTYSGAFQHFLYFQPQPAEDSIPVALKVIAWSICMNSTNSLGSDGAENVNPAACSRAMPVDDSAVAGNPEWTSRAVLPW